MFHLAQAITQVATLAVIIAYERKSQAVNHLMPLSFCWVVNFVMTCLFSATAIARFLCTVAVRGHSGISVIREFDSGVDSRTLVQLHEHERASKDENMSGYASASLFSRAVFLWVNPLIQKGYKSPLKADEVPSLPTDHCAEKMSELFELNWPKPAEDSKHPVKMTLFRCFWRDIAFIGFLAILRLAVMFIGPVLIQSFVGFTSGKGSDPNEGYYLVLTLLIAKTIEVLSSHQFNFQSQRLGMLIRSSLITSLYKKGLRLSCSSRQAHGVGQIVNYMAVDAQQLSDMMVQLHSIWLMPLQVAVALVLLYGYLKVSALATLLGVILVLAFVVVRTLKNNFFQYNVMRNRDLRIKAINEMLNYMRVIKFQAWEEHSGRRIQSFREQEYSWLAKFLYSSSWNMVVLWTAPIAIAALTFAAATLIGLTLDAGTVFTATTIFRILQEPIRNFLQALNSMSQAVISIERLENYMKSGELKEDSVEREEGCSGNIAVEVKDGTFSWEDEGGEEVLKNLNLDIEKGQLAAVVGTVGSGKSSLLASILGEMHKISGKVTVCGTTAYVAQTSWIQNDLAIMEDEDRTEIGERGINLSGGQKQRIQLARAVYQDCDVYLLDDIFSAVDAETGSQIYKECVRGALKDKTIVLVTHQVDFLHNVDRILVMRDGMIVQSGKYEEHLNSGMDFGALVAAHETSIELSGMNNATSGDTLQQAPKSPHRSLSREKSTGEKRSLDQSKSEDISSSKLIEDEERETGRVSLDVYKQYCTQAFGWWAVASVILTSLLWQACLMASDFWLAYETSEARTFIPSLFIIVYAIIAVVSAIFVASFLVAFLSLRTAQSFFNQLLSSILHAPMSFFDTTPSGRILTRVSTDQANVDLYVPMYLSLGYYLASSREMNRLDSITKAPVIHHFSETIYGVMTICAFRRQGRFFRENINKANANLRMDFHNNALTEWLGFCLELIGIVALCIATLLMILLPSTIIKPEYVGLSLSYGLSLNGVLFWAVYMSCVVENRMVSVERIKQFTKIPSEPAWRTTNSLPLSDWPIHGNIELKNLQVRYRQNTPLVLKGITLRILGGVKIGVIGRTGNGKSTLVQVFFRLIEPSGGKIIIDGVDICKLGLHDLWSRFGIIPQEPVLFEGTVRSNIDPIGLYSDEEIWKSLSVSYSDLMELVDSGDDWSVGQTQLLCLARVMLKHSKILFLDEATASVDSQTDAFIQNIIREDFASCTIISIAHRIPSVMDSDRVLVIDAGRAKEFDKPSNLLERTSLFAALVQEYANRSSGL
ncbi:hypothetical protein EZV62_000308 [Acer yangbiense]|uniref:ABC-type xenobiotic transporter n=1 Tax=Acer yangbiense TaxID=1000413 RepID=A0A5C7IRL6_9ROSI|nr:hypothetical protein EZV62_000308 [Acer yangbiense]